MAIVELLSHKSSIVSSYFASTEPSSNSKAGKSFNGIKTSTEFWVGSNKSNEYIGVAYKSSVVINKVDVTNQIDRAKNIKIQASNDNVNYNDLAVGVLPNTGVQTVTISFDNSTAYTYYRVLIVDVHSTNNCGINEIEMYGYEILNKFLILSNDDVVRSFKDEISENTIPKMTSNNTPQGVVKYSGIMNTGYDGWKAFNNDETNGWRENNNFGRLSYEFSEPKKIVKYVLETKIGNASRMARDWKFEGSNDGIIWNVLDSRSAIVDWSTNTKQEFTVEKSGEFKMYRLNVTSNVNHANLNIDYFEMMEGVSSIVNIPSHSEQNFISHGMDKGTAITLQAEATTKVFIEQSSTALGSGKVFKKNINTSLTPIKKVEIKQGF